MSWKYLITISETHSRRTEKLMFETDRELSQVEIDVFVPNKEDSRNQDSIFGTQHVTLDDLVDAHLTLGAVMSECAAVRSKNAGLCRAVFALSRAAAEISDLRPRMKEFDDSLAALLKLANA